MALNLFIWCYFQQWAWYRKENGFFFEQVGVNLYQKQLELVAYSNTRGSVNDKILYHVCCNTRLVKKSLADRIASTSGKKILYTCKQCFSKLDLPVSLSTYATCNNIDRGTKISWRQKVFEIMCASVTGEAEYETCSQRYNIFLLQIIYCVIS